MVAGIWALNPVQTNAVTYLVQRMTSLSSLFFILALCLYVMGRRRAQRQLVNDLACKALYCATALATALGMLCKENAAMIPAAILLTEWWFFQPDLHLKALAFAKRRWIVVLPLTLLVLALAFKLVVGFIGAYGGRHFTALERLMTEARIVVWYISVLLWPDPGRLSLEHHVELSTSLIHPFTTLLSIVFLGFLTFWIFWRREKYTLATYGLMWFLLNLVIESTIVPLELLFEHRMYLPSLGLFLAVVSGLQHLVPRLLTRMTSRDAVLTTGCLVAMVAAGLSLATFSRNQAWSDPAALGADHVAKFPESPRAHANFAVALSRMNRCEEAIEQAKAAIDLGKKNYEEYGVSVNTILICYRNMGQYERILQEAKGYVDAWPPYADVYTMPSVLIQQAQAAKELGDTETAYQFAQTALTYNLRMTLPIPDFEKVCFTFLTELYQAAKEKDLLLPGMDYASDKGVGAKYWSALQLMHSGYLAAGEQRLRQLAKIDSTHAAAVQEVLRVSDDYGQRNSVQASKWSFEKKYVHNPFSRFNASMAIAYLIRERRLSSVFNTIGEAFLDYALSLQPSSSDAHLLKGWYYFERNQVAEALAAANRAIELEPDNAKAWMGLGFFLTKGTRPAEAVPAFSKALELYPGYPQRSSIIGIIHSLEGEA
ncbi:MAG: tetratricopeptide repeat protein [Syntrophobacteraceae bacterium]